MAERAANEANEVNTALKVTAFNGQLDVQYLVGQRAKVEEALKKGSITQTGTVQSRSKVSSDKEENKARTSPAIADKKPKTKSTPAKKPPQEGIKTRETKPASGKKVPQDIPKPALQKGSIAPSGTAQSRSKVSSDKEENKAGTFPAIADKKPAKKRKATKEKDAPNHKKRILFGVFEDTIKYCYTQGTVLIVR
ncbi:uncharacterized protein LOC105437485 [Strongylocentrotus purpuratus]|uniref:Uncharacterized protein n=1 Tax=Strongylocentrotus purpuratus TaxID=7668 RepID=A0A7M7HCG0_STRPU|nr:uncharacterized protein LOC105437485 [Strongylocentrotus purpuratus]|eukprot:XP_011662433.1 PREDICTED: uncharacterized protein LOC105437485 [Strongylocentrotus purpuratus]